MPARAPKLDLASVGRGSTPSAIADGPAMYPVRPAKYVLDAPLPDLGARGVVWRVNPRSVDAGDVQRFAAALGVGGTPTRTSTGWEVQGTNANLSFSVSDGAVDVSYEFGVPSAVGGSVGSTGSASSGGATSGSGSTNSATKAEPPIAVPQVPTVASPVDVPSGADAERTARDLLDRLAVLTGQQWSTSVADSGGTAVACAVGAACPIVPPEVFARTVTFTLMLDGMRVDGVNWSVTIGEHHRIEAVNGVWGSPGSVGSYPIRTTADAFTDLRHGDAKFPGPQPMTANSAAETGAPTSGAATPNPDLVVHISGVSLGLARWDAYDNGHLVVDLVPTYRFHAKVEGGATYDIDVLALSASGVTFTNPTPEPQPLPAQLAH